MRRGRWFRQEGGRTTCLLCAHQCSLREGAFGFCGMRRGTAEGIELPAWGRLTAGALDPIEKKPLYHFYPGSPVWSIGFAGCSMDCPYCQNAHIARATATDGKETDPAAVVRRAMDLGVRLLAFTYSEPSIHAEYLIETAEESHRNGLHTVLVSNGMVNPEPAEELVQQIDGINIDLKSWNPDYYRRTLRGNLETVKRFIQIAHEHTWIELTTLVVPGDNDSNDEMRGLCSWVAGLSPDIPLHLSAYYPSHKYTRPPTEAAVLTALAETAREYLNFVYLGNLGGSNHTRCPGCHRDVIRRLGYSTECLATDGRCPGCGEKIAGVFR
ncbi:MAG: AmmeMemoRadiSam system radical SAM enzyme [Spirochaeta sp. LUC14_002_19_P3]|nr:MAG: AmmeMemoRadiSam system radical SAM enzyme [Spirochaeta sp. LUC14_002_19_P3]